MRLPSRSSLHLGGGRSFLPVRVRCESPEPPIFDGTKVSHDFYSKYHILGAHPAENVISARVREDHKRVCILQGGMSALELKLQRQLSRRFWQKLPKELVLKVIQGKDILICEYFEHSLYSFLQNRYKVFEDQGFPEESWFEFIEEDLIGITRGFMLFCRFSFPLHFHGNIMNGTFIISGVKGISLKFSNLSVDGSCMNDLEAIRRILIIIASKLPLELLNDLDRVDLHSELPVHVTKKWKDFFDHLAEYTRMNSLPTFFFEDEVILDFDDGFKFMDKMGENFYDRPENLPISFSAIYKFFPDPPLDKYRNCKCPCLRMVYNRNHDSSYKADNKDAHFRIHRNCLVHVPKHLKLLIKLAKRNKMEALLVGPNKDLSPKQIHAIVDEEFDVVSICFKAVRSVACQRNIASPENSALISAMEFRDVEDEVYRVPRIL